MVRGRCLVTTGRLSPRHTKLAAQYASPTWSCPNAFARARCGYADFTSVRAKSTGASCASCAKYLPVKVRWFS